MKEQKNYSRKIKISRKISTKEAEENMLDVAIEIASLTGAAIEKKQNRKRRGLEVERK